MAINLGSNFNKDPQTPPTLPDVHETLSLEDRIFKGNNTIVVEESVTTPVIVEEPQATKAPLVQNNTSTLLNSNNSAIVQSKNTSSPLVSKPVHEEEVAEFTRTYKEKLRQLPEVEALTGEINIDDLNTILSFGQEASKGISKVSDNLLGTIKEVEAEEAGEMIQQLAKVMDKFDVSELKDPNKANDKQGFFGKMFNKAKVKTQETIDSLFHKYDSMGAEVDKIYVILKKYEQQIEDANRKLKMLYDANINFYQELERYIVAGEIGLDEFDNTIIPQYEAAAADPSNHLAYAQVETLRRTRDMLEQRVYDLRLAENVALQSIPMIQGIEYSNFNLTRKINSAFIITLPIFKQCLTQAVMLKRQELQAKSLKALDEKTNELLLRNAETMARQTTEIARMAGGSSIQFETLEKTWQTIVDGIEQTKQIEEENHRQRVENSKKLEAIKAQMLMPRK